MNFRKLRKKTKFRLRHFDNGNVQVCQGHLFFGKQHKSHDAFLNELEKYVDSFTRILEELPTPKKVAKLLVKKKRQKNSADHTPGVAKFYISSLLKYYKDHGTKQVIIYARVSRHIQAKNKNIETQIEILRGHLEKRGIEIVGCYRETSPGGIKFFNRRKVFVEALEKANELDVPVVAVSVDRFLRCRSFHSKYRPNAVPYEAEFFRLEDLCCHVPLLTLLSPEMPPLEVRGYQSKWAMRIKNKKGGRPKKHKPGYKKQRRQEKFHIVRKFYESGMSIRKIAWRIRIPKSTVSDWCRKIRLMENEVDNSEPKVNHL